MKRREFAALLLAGAALAVTRACTGNRVAGPPSLLPPPAFPRLANVYYGPISRGRVPRLARYDLLICSGESAASSQYQAIKEANPSVRILPYIDSLTGAFAEPGGPLDTPGFSNDWYLTTSTGTPLSFYHDVLNCSDRCATNSVGQRWSDFLARWVHDNYWSKGIGDGVFFDNCWNRIDWLSTNLDLGRNDDNDLVSMGGDWVNQHWEAGVLHLAAVTRELLGQNSIIVCNGPVFGERWENGQLNEGFREWQGPAAPTDSFSANLNRYFKWTDEHFGDEYYVLCQDPFAGTEVRTNYQEMRYWLGVALLGDGYFSFSGPQTSGYDDVWWYDEYAVDPNTGRASIDPSNKGYLGYPQARASEVKNGVWRRDYDNGVVFVNTTAYSQDVVLETSYRRISGTQAPNVNSGGKVSSVSLPSQDGIVLLRSI